MNKSIEESVTSTNTQVRTVCAKELRGEAGCKELCDECKGKEFDAYLTETRNSFVKAITEVYPHEERLDDYARSTIRVAAEDILIAFDQLRDRFIGGNDGWTRLVDLLATHGGSIVSTASLSPEWIEQAKASNRMYVNEDGLGFVWEPDIKGIPETVEEVEWFEKWYPLKIELPEKVKTLDWMHKLSSNSKQVK